MATLQNIAFFKIPEGQLPWRNMVNIDSQQEGKVLVVTLDESRLDSPLAQDFLVYLKAQIDAGSTMICLDLSAVTFIDSTGLGAMVASLKYLKSQGSEAELWLIGVRIQVLSLFKLTRMDRVFPIYSDLTAALQAQ